MVEYTVGIVIDKKQNTLHTWFTFIVVDGMSTFDCDRNLYLEEELISNPNPAIFNCFSKDISYCFDWPVPAPHYIIRGFTLLVSDSLINVPVVPKLTTKFLKIKISHGSF